MPLQGLLDVVTTDPAVAGAIGAARDGDRPTHDITAPAALQPLVLAAVADKAPRTVLAVTATGREAEDLATALRSLVDPAAVVEFPAWETLPHERLSPRSDTVGARLAALRRLRHPGPDTGMVSVVVAPVRSVLQPLVPGLGDLEPVTAKPGMEVPLEDLVDRLAAAAYTRTDLVEKRGEFAVRGGLLDVFPPTEEHPLRVEFFGDTVEDVRYFRVADQRTVEEAPTGLWAPPCRELLLTDEVRDRARTLAAEHPELAEMLEPLAEGVAVEGMEALAPALVGDLVLLLDELPAGTHVVLCDPERVRTRAHDLVRTSEEFLQASWAAAAGGGKAPVDLGSASLRSIAEVREHALALGIPWWSVTPFAQLTDDEMQPAEDGGATVDARAAEEYRGDTERALASIEQWLADEYRVVLVTEGHGPAERLVELLGDSDLGARYVPELKEPPEAGLAHVTTGELAHGFVADGLRLVVLTEADLAGQRSSTKDMRRLPSRRGRSVDPLQLQTGDYVVHEQHGVGRYVELVSRAVQGATREYLVIEYASSRRGQPGDRLYVPTDQLDQVTRYVGGEAPSLNKLGGSDWAKTKGRARKAVREIAGELIRLYSARQATEGHAFGQDTPWQHELEDAFPYVETPDQQSAIDEVKGDMERVTPMDRLICGDVGYGKTEIAVRAAFKAVQDGKQVAVLCPTTLLAQQHLSTFSERFAQFPVVVKSLSRFVSGKEHDEVLAGLTAGSVDVVIGTHRLLSSEVNFKQLGLVIVDEEQRFGVEHKEFLKRMRTQVDVLTMSATPIPRTLEMGMTGIREMSVMQTPPEERHPVLTFVGAYDERQIFAAIRRELLRDGQVFLVHNRVQSIEKVASRIHELVPEARVAVAHGQMGEHKLEQVMVGFWEKEFDVLVCTTIVESGLDIPNANTLIVDRADILGLGQLHQLRGRVGRSRERGYSYFLYPPDKPLNEHAYERLQTVAQHTELGAGTFVAVKDLEIRGSGNLLGDEQSGHIAGVGFDLYVRLVGEAVAEYRGEAPQELADVRVELPLDAHIPHGYVASERLRFEAYQRIAQAASDDDIAAVRDELTDRYGTVPVPVETLLDVARFRARARELGITDVTLQGNQVRFAPLDLRESQQLRLKRLYPGSVVKQPVRTVLIPRPKAGGIGGQLLRDRELLTWCRGVLDALFELPAAAVSSS
ncbi:MAG: transcription-repair coupling factor [Streptosporangiales bacterium]|nr:transcription-repair coupling factor [Streptosporangiales bacterium]